ncbi:MAG: acetyl-CoA hydrolase/transferase family protein [Acidobacteria bacterium]|nr:acetyl-CoA hydrolase/transferase family protein [Acidobacteriota bacterium]MBI3655633.1 acetyl-CoA hydrolase/transferase family protein [Acidobacteriota bacterium]
MNWLLDYQKKRVSAEAAVALIKSGDRVFTSGNAATPYVLLSALAMRKHELHNVEITHVLLIGDDPLSKPGMEEHFRHNSLFVGPADREAVNEGRADYVPIFLHEIPALFTGSQMPLDAAIIQTAPPDEHGFMSLGVETLATLAAVNSAKLVLAQVNSCMPRTLGDCFVHISKIAKLTEVSEPLPELPAMSFSEVEQKIGESVAQLVEDGSTLQMGIGGIPDAVLASLEGKRDLGIHTEMVSDGVMTAIEAGIVTGSRKTLHAGKAVATFALGSSRLYEYLHNNPMFEFHPSHYTNDPFIIAQNDRMVAVNSALEVDLTGQVCADSVGQKIYSGFGGQVDFIRGAARSKGGKPIIAMPATAKRGEVSRIVPTLKRGAGVVTTRADVHYVVTEFGTAYLHGLNLRKRAEALIAVAHPRFRDELFQSIRQRVHC